MDLTKKTIKAGSWQFASVATRALLQLVVLAVLARYVSPKEFGYIAMANMVMVFVDMFADAGIGPAIIQKNYLTERHIRAGFCLSILLGVLFMSILWFCAPFIELFFKTDNLVNIIRWIGVSALITKIGIVSRSRLERDMKFDILMWIDVGSYFFGYALVGIVMAVQGFGAWAIVVGKISQCCLQTTCLLSMRPNSVKPLISGNEYKELLSYGGGLTLSRIFDNLASQGDYFIVGRFLGSTYLGFYERASSIMAMPGQYLNLVLDKTLFPAMSQIQSQEKRLEKAYFMSTSIVCTLLIPLTVVMYLTAPEIIATLLGPNWSASIILFRVLIFTVIFRIFMNVSDTLVRATGAVYGSAVRKAVLAFMILFGSWIGHFWGLTAVAIAVDISILIGYFLMLQLCMRIIKFRLIDYLKIYKHGLAIGLILWSIILPLVTTLRSYTESELLVLCAASFCSILLIIILFLFYPMIFGESVVGFINQVLLMLRSKRVVTF